ncbi:polysaccharide deacetylase family protein [Paenibacillus harenae]|uniref:polysaccharide deacetylase family protein n=1 Tax=Paenibacillus harenae TaxID=306543 RepID=UPI0003F8ECD6|nr:polysaccharide deacetylase family protein [Paenibacillus harenae]
MEKAKKRRRRLLVLIILAAVMVWIGGCAMSQSLGLSALVPAGSSPIAGEGPLTAGGTKDVGELVVIGDGGSASDGGVTHGSWEPEQDSGAAVGRPPRDHGNDPDDAIAADRPDGQTMPDGSTGPDMSEPSDGAVTDMPDLSAADESGSAVSDEPGRGAADTSEAEGPRVPDPSNADDPRVPPGAADTKPGKDEKLVALTFDDGPDIRYTTDILDILKEKGVKATFFVVGQQVKKNPEVLKRIVDEGHAIGNHSYNHKDLSKLNKQQILEEMSTNDAIIKDAVGFTPTMFRAPYGAVSDTLKNVLKANNRKLIGWNVDTRDWAGTPPSDMREMIRTETKPGGIILMHSFGGKHIKNTVEALPGIIDDLEEMGYSFVAADQA